MDSPSQNSRQAPPTSRDRSVYPSVGKKRHPFSLGKGNKKAPISSSSSEDGRELPLKKRGWSSAGLILAASQAFKHKKVDSLLRVPRQEESFFQVALGKMDKRRELLSRRELHYLLVSRVLFLRRLKKPLSKTGQSPPDFNNIALSSLRHRKPGLPAI